MKARKTAVDLVREAGFTLPDKPSTTPMPKSTCSCGKKKLRLVSPRDLGFHPAYLVCLSCSWVYPIGKK